MLRTATTTAYQLLSENLISPFIQIRPHRGLRAATVRERREPPLAPLRSRLVARLSFWCNFSGDDRRARLPDRR